jgi:hypothetical protein
MDATTPSACDFKRDSSQLQWPQGGLGMHVGLPQGSTSDPIASCNSQWKQKPGVTSVVAETLLFSTVCSSPTGPSLIVAVYDRRSHSRWIRYFYSESTT